VTAPDTQPSDGPAAGLDAASLRRAFGHYPTGVAVVTATSPTAPHALVVSSFISVSRAPPLVAFCAARMSTTWPAIAAAGRCCVNVLSDDQHVGEAVGRHCEPGIEQWSKRCLLRRLWP
jgi:flavin reductase (DIM6/NTAB) family NADH-FMN oxidoreductase RutF